MFSDDARPAARIPVVQALGLGLVAQVIWSAVTWLIVNDQSQGLGYFANEDFKQWFVASCVGVVMLTLLGVFVARGRALAFAAGCVLGVGAWLVIFVGFAIQE